MPCRAVLRCASQIVAEMIKYMGKYFHAPHTAISMLESHVTLFPQVGRAATSIAVCFFVIQYEFRICSPICRTPPSPC